MAEIWVGSATVVWAGGGVEPSGVQVITRVQGPGLGLQRWCGLAVGWRPVERRPQSASNDLRGV